MKFKPHRYQEQAIEFVKEHKCCCLFLDMGLGKTVSTLTAISDLFDELAIRKVLVVAPKMVALSTWAQECRKWDHLSDLSVSVVMGDLCHRSAALDTEADIYVTSRDLLSWLVVNRKWNFDVVVLDELTSFKSSNSKRFKAFKSVRPFVHRVIGLTGTPVPNGLMDLWAQMYCIDMGKSLGKSKKMYVNEHFNTYTRNNITLKATIKPGHDRIIYERIGDEVLTMKAVDHISVPPLIEITQRVKLSDKVLDKYIEFERDRVIEVTEETSGATDFVVATSAVALMSKLQQFSNGAMYVEDTPEWTEIHQEKLDALMELIEQAHSSGESVLVFYQFKHDYERAVKRAELKEMRVAKYSGEHEFELWNSGELDVLFTHAASTAYGLNLQLGGHVIVWYGTGWNAELYLQGNARLYRQGQTHPTRVYRLVCEGTVDEDAAFAVTGKIDRQEAMLTALKKRQKLYINEEDT